MLLQIEHGTVSRDGNVILSDFSFEIRGTEKIAVTGANGTGKSTLLGVISGELELDRDDRYQGCGMRTSRAVTIDMLHQTAIREPDMTVEDHLLREYVRGLGIPVGTEEEALSLTEKERFDFETEYDRLFTGFGFAREEKKKRMGEFSGGQQTRIALIRLLLSKPDILLLDEPTNHLDLDAVEWLEEYLKTYEKAVVMVSHDRYFLDQVADVVYEVRNGKLDRYSGNYSEYRKEKIKKDAIELRRYQEQQEEIRRLDELIRKFKNKPRKASFARSRQKILDRMEKMEKPDPEDGCMNVPVIQPGQPGSKWVWETEAGVIGYDRPLRTVDLRIRRGQKIGIVGPNGAGKSTFLKTVAGRIPLLGGKEKTGLGIDMGYFDQASAAIRSEETVLAYFSGRFPLMPEREARKLLGSYGFGGRDVLKTVSSLSGGEKSRLTLCMLFLTGPNFLILDEPTNHMDIRAMEMLEKVLSNYKGTILLVSHDRYFLDRVTDQLLVFEKEGDVLFYPFGYDHYRKRQRSLAGEGNPAAARTAREQAMIEGLKAVPKKETGMLRQFSTESLYEDWRFRLLEEELNIAREELEKQMSLRLQEAYYLNSETEAESEEKIKEADLKYLELCLQWQDLWEEFQTNL